MVEEESNQDNKPPKLTKEEKAEIAYANSYRQYWKNIREWQNLPLLRCPIYGCDFKNVYQESIDQHLQYSNRKGHNTKTT